MIYLRCWLSVLKGNFFKTVLILLLSVGSTTLLVKKQEVLGLLGLVGQDSGPRLSFVTTLDSNFQNLKNKIIVLPGVKRVEQKSGNSIKEKISLLFKSEVLQDVLTRGPGYNKFTIIFKDNISNKSINLIKSYIIKILSGDEVFFGKVVGQKKKTRFTVDHAFYFIYGFSILFMLSIYSFLEVRLRKVAYLFQRFQRGSGVVRKVSFLYFFSISIFPMVLVLGISGDLYPINLLMFIVPTSVFYFFINLKKYSWLNFQ